MSYQYVVLGAGRQGVAIAYDLARNCEARRIVIADIDPDVARRAIERLQTLLPKSACEFFGVICDVSKPAEVAMTIAGADVAVSATSYRYNVALTEAAIAAHVHLCDLGGNTEVVRQQLVRHERAVDAAISIVPDCGLAPGLGNILAAHGIAQMDTPTHVQIRCGGLPQKPVGPLGYKLVFSFEGLINEYSGNGEFIRDGQRVDVPTLTELEEIDFGPPLGRCEAAVTSGGTSTCPQTYDGRLKSYDYKTVRYPGHFAIMRALFELGCLDRHVTLAGGDEYEPRSVFQPLMEHALAYPDVRDLVVLRTIVTGQDRGTACRRQYDLLDYHDEETGFSAMERTTGYPTAIVAYLQARKLIEPGARPLEVAVPTDAYMPELPRHDINVVVSE